jgi:hypothetical protein
VLPPRYSPEMAYYVFNFSSEDRERAVALLRAKMWGIGGAERHRNELAPAMSR